jgi:ankyrin repeat protein
MSAGRRVAIALLVLLSSFVGEAAVTKSNPEASAKLLAAAERGDEDNILAAIAAGGDANARDEGQNTPLILAAPQSLMGKERLIVEALVKAKAQIDAVNKEGMSALMAAASGGRDDMVKLLIENQAKVDARDNDVWSALMYASSAGKWNAAKELIAAKADVNAADKKGWTPLMLALSNGRGSVAEHLIAAGAKMPVKSPNGLSAIQLAAYGRDLGAVRQVLEAGQPLDGRDEDGWTALEVASFKGDGQIVMELLRAGADASLKDKEGHTALDRAKESKHDEIVAILGGPWTKPKPKGGTSIAIPCAMLGGNVEANFAVDGKALVVTTAFPKPMTYYLGGGFTNRAKSATKFVYDGMFAPAYYLDTDSNAKTGVKEAMLDKESIGSEYAIGYSEYGTSVSLTYKDSSGKERTKTVYANELSVDIKKEDQAVDLSEVGTDDRPDAANDSGILVTRVPLSLLKLSPGKTIRVTAKIGSCAAVVSKVKLE